MPRHVEVIKTIKASQPEIIGVRIIKKMMIEKQSHL